MPLSQLCYWHQIHNKQIFFIPQYICYAAFLLFLIKHGFAQQCMLFHLYLTFLVPGLYYPLTCALLFLAWCSFACYFCTTQIPGLVFFLRTDSRVVSSKVCKRTNDDVSFKTASWSSSLASGLCCELFTAWISVSQEWAISQTGVVFAFHVGS